MKDQKTSNIHLTRSVKSPQLLPSPKTESYAVGFLRDRKKYIPHVTAAYFSTLPIWAAAETFFGGASNAVSIRARCVALALNYAGIGETYTRARDRSRKIFCIDEKSSKLTLGVHDSIFTIGYTALVNPMILLVAGAEYKDIWPVTKFCMGVSLFAGPIGGRAIDLVSGSIDGNESKPPLWTNSLSPKSKLFLATFLLAVSLGLTAFVYKMTPDPPPPETVNPTEQLK